MNDSMLKQSFYPHDEMRSRIRQFKQCLKKYGVDMDIDGNRFSDFHIKTYHDDVQRTVEKHFLINANVSPAFYQRFSQKECKIVFDFKEWGEISVCMER
jgi:hypothetical protein